MEELPIHPSIVHFAIVLPIITLIFEAIFRISKNYTYSHISYFLAILSALAFAGAMFSGNIDGPNAYPLMSSEGQHELKEHKELGLYITIAMGILAMVKIASVRLKKEILGLVFLVGMIGVVGITMQQGHDGGELVYKYAANVECPEEEED